MALAVALPVSVRRSRLLLAGVLLLATCAALVEVPHAATAPSSAQAATLA